MKNNTIKKEKVLNLIKFNNKFKHLNSYLDEQGKIQVGFKHPYYKVLFDEKRIYRSTDLKSWEVKTQDFSTFENVEKSYLNFKSDMLKVDYHGISKIKLICDVLNIRALMDCININIILNMFEFFNKKEISSNDVSNIDLSKISLEQLNSIGCVDYLRKHEVIQLMYSEIEYINTILKFFPKNSFDIIKDNLSKSIDMDILKK